MKKLLLLACCLFGIGVRANAQTPYAIPISDYSVLKDGGLAIPLGYLTIKDETTPLTARGTLSFLGSGVTCVDNAGNTATECTITAGSGYNAVQEEAGALTARSTLNFIGTLITCADNAGATRTDCTVGSAYSTVQDEGSNLAAEKTINFIGSGVVCADNAGSTRTDCTITSGGAPVGATYITQVADGTLTNEQALGALTTGLVKNTTSTGVLSIYGGTSCTNQFPRSLDASGAATCADVAAADFANQSARTILGNFTSGSADPSFNAGGGAGTYLVDNGTTLAFQKGASASYPGLNFDPTLNLVAFDDFLQDAGNAAAVTTAIAIGPFYRVGVSGSTSAGRPGSCCTLVGDGNHPGITAITTGTTTTGSVFLGAGLLANSTSDSINWTPGSIFETLVWVDNAGASDATDTWKMRAGGMDVTSGTGQDEAYIYWDNNADTHWGCQMSEAGSRTSTISTTVATVNAWHRLKVTQESNQTHFYVDGSELSCSPAAANRTPHLAAEAMSFGVSATATAGCSSATWANAANCSVAMDYMYLYAPLASAR